MSALYSPWQRLYAQDAISLLTLVVPVETLLGGEKSAGYLKEIGQLRAGRIGELDKEWRSILYLLVRIQNRFLPEVTGRVRSTWDPETGERIDPFVRERDTFDSFSVLSEEFSGDIDRVAAVFHFLVEQGLDRDSRDGLTSLRRAVPRAFHTRWRGEARLAQDFFDAAEMLRRFLIDAGHTPGPAVSEPVDGRQLERRLLYERGPASRRSQAVLAEDLKTAELFPFGVHVFHEGACERTVIEALVEATIGPSSLEEVQFTDMDGAGGASKLSELLVSLEKYSRHSVIIVDDEAKARRYVDELVDLGRIDEQDVLIFDSSFEEANMEKQVLIECALRVADEHGRSFKITVKELEEFTADEQASAQGEIPSLATCLLKLIREKTNGWTPRKLEITEVWLDYLFNEIQDMDPASIQTPIVRFTYDRIVASLLRPMPIGPR